MRKRSILTMLLVSTAMLKSGSSFASASCTSNEINKIRTSALRLYNKGDYANAEYKLSQYYREKCSFHDMSQLSDNHLNSGLWLISDLMLYRKKLNDQLGCLSLGDEVYNSWMVSQPERHDAKVELALQTNIAQCQNALDTEYSLPVKCPIKGYEYMYAIPNVWREQNEKSYEVACIDFVENSRNVIGEQRDGPKYQSEGMNTIARFDLLYVSQVSQHDESSTGNNSWIRHYELDPIYITTNNGVLWGDEYCYSFDIHFGKKAGVMLLEGSSHYCSGGTASFINRLIMELDYPLKIQIIDEQSHTVK